MIEQPELHSCDTPHTRLGSVFLSGEKEYASSMSHPPPYIMEMCKQA